MSNFTPVKPGDLITAAYFNQVLGSFDQRISALEGSVGTSSGAMLITGISPSGPVHMGDTITLLGQNFGLPSQVIVTVGGVIVTGSSFLAGSGNNTLIFQVPPVPNIPPLGQTVSLMVSNPTNMAPPFSIFLLPFVLSTPTGSVFATMTGAPSVGSITAGNNYTFVFTITASTSLGDNYNLAATLDSASKAAGWTVSTVNATSGFGINQIQIPQGQSANIQVGVKVTIPAIAGVTSAQITLTITSVTNSTGLFGSGFTTVTVGTAPPPPNAISFTNPTVTANLPGASFSGNSISLPAGATSAVIGFQAVCPNPDKYSLSAVTFDASGWAASVANPPSGSFQTSTANQPVTIQIQLTTIPSGSAQTNMHFQVQSTTQSSIIGQLSPSISV